MRAFVVALLLPMAAPLAAPTAEPSAPPPGSVERMDYGPVIGHSYRFPEIDQSPVGRGMAIQLPHDLTVLFDTAHLRYALGKTGGSIDLADTDYMRAKGNTLARLTGEAVFRLTEGAAWSATDVFPTPANGRPLPREKAIYAGYYRSGDRVVLAYRVAEVPILEMPSAVQAEGHTAFVRHIRVGESDKKLTLRLCTVASDGHTSPRIAQNRREAWAPVGETRQWVGLDAAPEDAHLFSSRQGEIRLRMPPQSEPTSFQVLCARIPEGAIGVTKALRSKLDPHVDLHAMTEGGPSQWPQKLNRSATRNDKATAYVADTIPLPHENPWGSFMRISGLDFFPDGRAAVATLNGDVWLVDGLNDQEPHLFWKRYASGLYEPLGLEIREGDIFVTEQGQITRLHDLNGNGEADFYESFNNRGTFKPRAYWANLSSDSKGKFYFNKVGNRARNTPEHGCIIQVSPEGKSTKVFATGLRQANGLAIAPDDTIHATDQEGNWVPATRIDYIKQGRFYGYRPSAPREIPVGSFAKPICWLPQNVDNSAGSQVYVDDARWGPLAGHWLHTSWGLARLFVMLTETVEGIEQGGVAAMPTGIFSSGIMRAEVNPADGQIYVAGLGIPGWTGVGRKPGCLNRIRYTGKPTRMPVGLHAHQNGIQIEFQQPLAPDVARDPGNYTVKRWTYKYTADYGSAEYSLENPDKPGRDPVQLSKVTLGPEEKTVFLHIPDMKPVRQMSIRYEIRSKAGAPIANTLYHTIHKLGDPF